VTDIFCIEDVDDCDLYFEAQLDTMKTHNFIIKKESNNNIVL